MEAETGDIHPQAKGHGARSAAARAGGARGGAPSEPRKKPALPAPASLASGLWEDRCLWFQTTTCGWPFVTAARGTLTQVHTGFIGVHSAPKPPGHCADLRLPRGLGRDRLGPFSRVGDGSHALPGADWLAPLLPAL